MSVAWQRNPGDDSAAYGASWGEIVDAMTQRRSQRHPLLTEMLRVREQYNGDVVVIRPDVKGSPVLKPPSPALVADSIDNIAMRAGQTRPIIGVPALDDSKVKSRDRAALRRRSYYAHWHTSALEILLRRAYRHYGGYGTCALVVVPDHEREMASIEMRDPLSAYPDFRHPDDVREPRNVGFVYGRSVSWIRKHWSARQTNITRYLPDSVAGSDVYDCVEWIDEDAVVLGILGPRQSSRYGDERNNYRTLSETFGGMELTRWPNRAGMVPVAMPNRLTLDRIMGQVTSVLNSVETLDMLQTLDYLAAEKAIFPDFVILGRDGREPQLVSGAWNDGRTGKPNIVIDGEVKILQSSPGPLTQPVIDRQERVVRMHTGLVPQSGGETPGALRTGRAIDAVGGFAVDPRVQEAQESMSRALMIVNQAVGETELGYWPGKKYQLFSGWPGDPGHVSYVPQDIYESRENVVSYSFPGTDISEASVVVSQLVGTRLMSKHTGRSKHPFIEDAEHEGKRVDEETLTEALMTGMLARAQSGELVEIDLAEAIKHLRSNGDVVEAVLYADKIARERQATVAPPAAPGEVMPPEAAAGIATPGMGAEAPLAPAVPDVDPGLGNVRDVLNALSAGNGRG